MNEGEIMWIDGDRCKVLLPLGSGHPTVLLCALRLSDGARVILFGDGDYAEVCP